MLVLHYYTSKKEFMLTDVYLKHEVSNDYDWSSQDMSQRQNMNLLQTLIGCIF
jgi:hypothetical protein